MEAVNTRAVGQTKLRVAQNDRTIVWSFKSGHYRRYMVVKTKKRRSVTIRRSQSMCDQYVTEWNIR